MVYGTGTVLYGRVRLGTLYYSKALHFSDFTTLKDTAFTFLYGTVPYVTVRCVTIKLYIIQIYVCIFSGM